MKKTLMIISILFAAMIGCAQSSDWQPAPAILEDSAVLAPNLTPSATTTFTDSQQVVIASPAQLPEYQGGKLVYSVDRSDPSCYEQVGTILYSGPFIVRKSLIVKARYCSGTKMSAISKNALLSVLD